MEDRLEIWLELIGGKLDRLIELGENVERASRLHEMLEDSGERQADHFAGANKMVADEPAKDKPAAEPPKKWRRLTDEFVQPGDWANAKVNRQDVDPPDEGWIPADPCYFGKRACTLSMYFARPVAEEPAKEPEHPAGPMPDPGEGYRLLSKDPPEELQPGDDFFGDWDGGWHQCIDVLQGICEQKEDRWYRRKIDPAKEAEHPAEPMPSIQSYRPVDDGDIGKIVEVQNSTADPWRECTLLAIDWDRPYGFLCGHVGFYRPMQWRFARIKIDEPAKEPEPAWEPKVGDWVRVTRPENWEKFCAPFWLAEMHQFDGKVGQIERESGGHFRIRGFVGSNGTQHYWHRHWLSPAEPPAKEEEPAEPEYREPVLPADAGKKCQFSDDGETWLSGWVDGWMPARNWVTLNNNSWKHARIKKDA